MNRPFAWPTNIAALCIRAAIFSLLLAAPVLAVPSASGGQSMTIEAPATATSGVGFVLLVSLQCR